MFISEKLVFIELQKTGCTHVRKTLKHLVNGRIEGKHNQVSADLFTDERAFIGSIRNPWEWYLSLWSYGCGHKGTLFERLTRPLKLQVRDATLWQLPYATLGALTAVASQNFRDWERVYQDANDIGAFRDWLHMMYDSQYRYDLGEGWGISPIHRFAGLLTHRYMRLFCAKAEETHSYGGIKSIEQLKEHDRNRCFVNYFIRNESLMCDLFEILDAVKIFVPTDKREKILQLPKTNTSFRESGPSYYYDQRTVDLVAKYESLIIDKFKYCPPVV